MSQLIVSVEDFLRLALGDGKWPKPLHLIQGALLVRSGLALVDAARKVGTSPAHLTPIARATDAVEAVRQVCERDITHEQIDKLRKNVGQLVLGRAAEIAFEDICRGCPV